MDIIGYFFIALARVLDIALSLYFWVIVIAALMSWVRPDPYNPVVRFLRAMTDPVFYRVRRWFPFLTIGGFDLSPIVGDFSRAVFCSGSWCPPCCVWAGPEPCRAWAARGIM